jgi:exosortase/archaeosortase family protein
MHLPRLLHSISGLNAPVFILDSGSTDGTVAIGEKFGATVLQHPFENHPKQWDYALKNFDVKTPWVIGLDADHTVTPELKQHLEDFNDADHRHINGIYFNRKNFFKGNWLRHGGYYPFYQLKMIRYGVGYSDLNENMDHRFVVPGNTIKWKDGHIIEENLKENNIAFWISKHNRYSDLLAQEEVERMQQMRSQTITPRFWGSPDERRASFKQLWWQLPRYTRPMLYFLYRMFFQLGILDGRTGIIFHFLQSFWFRLIVDVKIDEIIKPQSTLQTNYNKPVKPLKFVFSFLFLFLIFFYFNILFFGLTSPGNHYSPFLDHHLNYIRGLRWVLLNSSAHLLGWLGYTAITNEFNLLVAGHGVIQLVYSCLGLGVISFFAAFVLAYPKAWRLKLLFLVTGIIVIELLNIARFVLLALFWNKRDTRIVDHHTVFNIIIYVLVAISLYFWIRHDEPLIKRDAKN